YRMVALKPVAKNSKSAVKTAKKAIRKKKVHLKFNIECKNPAEDGIFNTEDFMVEKNVHYIIRRKKGNR
ncbi:hypothetical protein TELCIR_17452, partial [Teladorsagia circumcincta]